MKHLLLLSLAVIAAFASEKPEAPEIIEEKATEEVAQYGKARLETCGGWRLNRLPRVKAFISHHAPLYGDLEVRYIGGADPELVFVKEDDTEGERIPVDDLSTQEICDLLEKRGIMKNVSEDGEEMSGEEGEEDEEELRMEMERAGFPGHGDDHAGPPSPPEVLHDGDEL